jgi:hypothetical protein
VHQLLKNGLPQVPSQYGGASFNPAVTLRKRFCSDVTSRPSVDCLHCGPVPRPTGAHSGERSRSGYCKAYAMGVASAISGVVALVRYRPQAPPRVGERQERACAGGRKQERSMHGSDTSGGAHYFFLNKKGPLFQRTKKCYNS